MQEILQYSFLLYAIVILVVELTILLLVFNAWVLTKRENKRFFEAAIKSLKFKGVQNSVRGIRNDFEVYRRRRFGFKSEKIVELCQELERKLKLGDGNEDLSKLEEIILIFKDEEDNPFKDEKMENIIENVKSISGNDDARKLREYLIKVDAYNSGIIYEKDRHYKDMEVKLKRKKWVSILGYFLGVAGSIASIYTLFFS